MKKRFITNKADYGKQSEQVLILGSWFLCPLFFLCFLFACNTNKKEEVKSSNIETARSDKGTTGSSHFPEPFEEYFSSKNDTIIDADYSFEEAVANSKAPQSIIDQMTLFDVLYLSVDGKIHRGQILTNKAIEEEIRSIFSFMLEKRFMVEKAIPIVRYNWNDSISMADNNSYSFCYRNITYSKHASGMAIDINPRFNPVRWKTEKRPNQPEGAVLDTTVNGTFYPGHPVVDEFKRLGFRWGHSFTKFYDDHHFEKRF